MLCVIQVCTVDPNVEEGDCLLPENHLQKSFKEDAEAFMTAMESKCPPGSVQLPVVYVDWLRVEPISTITLRELFPFLVKKYRTKAFWMPATQYIINLLDDETSKIHAKVGMDGLVFVENPNENLLFTATRRSDSRLIEAGDKNYSSYAKLRGLLPGKARYQFFCLQRREPERGILIELGVQDVGPYNGP